MSAMTRLLCVVAGLSVAAVLWAGPYEVAFATVQKMLVLAAHNDETALNAARQQLESMPRPAHQNVKDARLANQRGLEALKLNDYAAAASAFQQAQQADPADVEVAGNLGYAQLKLGQLKRAEQQLAYAIALAPGRSSSWFNLGQVYGEQGAVEQATGAFANAWRYSQNRPKTEEFLRQALTAPENGATTRAALQRALALAPAPAPN